MSLNLDHDTVTAIVQKVLQEMIHDPRHRQEPRSGLGETVDEVVEKAASAQKRLLSMSLESRAQIIEAVRRAALENNEMLSALAVRETKLGRFEDKVRENVLCATKTPGIEDLRPMAISGDHGLMLLEYAPVGVIGALTPITNPTGTIINNSIGMIAAGNSVVFNPHPGARETSTRLISLLHEAIVSTGGPEGLIGCVRNPSLETAKQIIEHPHIQMLVATGGRNVVDVVLRSGKKAIGAGAGNPPVLVDETANIRNAAISIVNGASINNNIFCTCEKVVIVVHEVADSLMKFMRETGKVYELNSNEAEKVTHLVVTPP